jgi:hypothetical protein
MPGRVGKKEIPMQSRIGRSGNKKCKGRAGNPPEERRIWDQRGTRSPLLQEGKKTGNLPKERRIWGARSASCSMQRDL